MKKTFVSLALLLTACQVEYHPYDTRIDGPTNVNARNIARIEAACEGRRTIRFAQISDTQRWYDETEDAVKAINARDDIDFVIHTGDRLISAYATSSSGSATSSTVCVSLMSSCWATTTVWPPESGFLPRFSARSISPSRPATCASSA